MISATVQIIFAVELFWRTSSLTNVRSPRSCGSAISSRVTIHGPSGAEVSKFLPGPEGVLEAALRVRHGLAVAGGDVVRDRVAEDVVERALDRDVAAGLADDHGELDLVVQLAGDDRVVEHRARPGPITASGVLRKNSGSFWSTSGFSSRWSQ